MFLTTGVLDTLIICATLTALASLFTVVLSVVCGTTLAFHARPTFRYATALTLLFLPFAIGEGVWAYSITRLLHASGIQSRLLLAGTIDRATALLFLCLARTVPLGAFFVATTLQRYTSEIRPYFQTHQLRLPFFTLCSLARIPQSILMLLGLFGGSLMASEGSLALFLYRANPGTAPETINIMLARLFREIYASVGPDSLPKIATFGLLISALLLSAALLGILLGKVILSLIAYTLHKVNLLSKTNTLTFSILPHIVTMIILVPGLIGLLGLVVPAPDIRTSSDALEGILGYHNVVAVGLFVGAILTGMSIALAVKLRYSHTDLLKRLESKWVAACILLLPAFLPVLSVVALLGFLANGELVGAPAYFALMVSHLALHYSVFQFICMTLIAAIPEFHVSWQRTMRMNYSFSLLTDGFRRHSAVIISLIGLGTVQVVTDGSVSRWFSQLVKAPEETLYAAVFGRLSSATEATFIAWSVGVVATTVCVVLSVAYIRQLRNRPRYA